MFVCPVPKISQVKMKRRRRASHLGRKILCGKTAAELLRVLNVCNIPLTNTDRYARFTNTNTKDKRRGHTNHHVS